jgi:hypothetical protein
MPPILTYSQKAASALQRAERALRNWQDDPDSPRADVDKMLAVVDDLRQWVQGHVNSDIEKVERTFHNNSIGPPSSF